MFQMNDFPYFFYLFSHLFNSCHFKGEKQAGESALSAFTEIIKKILNESGIKGVDVNSRIITAFRKNVSAKEKSGFREKRRENCASVRKLLDK